MKYFLISDNVDTLAGMRLVGVRGVVVHEPEEMNQALEKACADPEIGLVLITDKPGGQVCGRGVRLQTEPQAPADRGNAGPGTSDTNPRRQHTALLSLRRWA